MVQVHIGVPIFLFGSLTLIGKGTVLKTVSSRREAVSRFESEGCRQICERDVIGKRCRFKICCRKVCGFESHRSYQPLLFVVRSGGVVVVGEKARNSIKSLDKGQGAEPMAR